MKTIKTSGQSSSEQQQPRLNITDMIDTISKLADLLAKETTLLKQKQIKQVEGLQADKERLTDKLEIYKKLMQKEPTLFSDFPKVKQAELEGVIRIFEKILEENYRELVKARAVNSKVVEAVTVAVNRHINSQRSYADNGSVSSGSGPMPSIAINEQI